MHNFTNVELTQTIENDCFFLLGDDRNIQKVFAAGRDVTPTITQ